MRLKMFLLSLLVGFTPSLAGGADYAWFVDLYGGASRPGSGDVEVEDLTFVPKRVGKELAVFGTSPALGIRNGIWRTDRTGLGLWWELSYLSAAGDTASFDAFALSGLVGWGWRLGRVTPVDRGWTIYVAGGINAVFAGVDAKAGGVDQDGLSIDDGQELCMGVMWNALRRQGGFIELRYLRSDVTVDKISFFGGSTTGRIFMDLEVPQIVLGWSIRLEGRRW